jgi:hypothetical protein
MNEGFQVLMVLMVLGFAVLSMIWHFSRSNSVLDQWAEDNGFELLSSEYRHFMRGPFFWTTSKGQTVYHVKVRTSSGEVKTGWVRCGGFFLGLLSDAAEVRWED